ncbi:MAG: cyclic nucleotide-binding/CBS domain-containing protein [Nitrospirales bacterium]
MVHIQDVMNRELVRVDDRKSVAVVANLMRIQKVGSVLVERDGEIVGIVTEADIVRKVVSMHRFAEYTPVKRIMSSPVICIDEDRPIFEAADLMDRSRVRHLAVANSDEGIIGVLSVRDLLHPVAIDDF